MSGPWRFFDKKTGVFLARKWSGPARLLARNTPQNCEPYSGEVDPLAQRMDVSSGEIVDYVPPAPSEDHEWNTQIKRWTLKPDIAMSRAEKVAALAKIVAIEQSQQRAIRELALDQTNEIARAKLTESDARIAQLREVLATNSKVNSFG